MSHLERVRDILRSISEEDEKQALHDIGIALKTKVLLGFRSETDPYGKRWAPLRHRRGQPLQDSGELRNSIRFRVRNSVLRLGTDKEYAIWHQEGFGRIPKRAFLPDGRGLPDSWAEEAVAILERHLFGKDQ